MDVVRPLVGEDRLEVTEVAHDRVLEGDAVAAEDVAADAGDLERGADVVALDHAHVRGAEQLRALQARRFRRLELHVGDLREHLGENFACTSWCDAIGLPPNWTRCLA